MYIVHVTYNVGGARLLELYTVMASPTQQSSDHEIRPTAPPQLISEEPPSYDAIAREDEWQGGPQRRTRVFNESLRFAGASIGRWFGVPYDDELEGVYRAGTLRHNQRVMSYSMIPQEEQELEIGPGRERGRAPEAQQPQRGQGVGQTRLHRVRNTLTATLQRRKKETKAEVLKSLPTFWPVVTILVTVIEVGLLIAVTITNGLAPIAFTPQQEFEVVRGFDNQTESVTREIVPNFFIGPTKQALVHSGALYAPCMRENIEFQIAAARDRLMENNLRCCKSSRLKQCGMLSQQECAGSTIAGTVLGGASVCRAEMNETNECEGGVTLHPCCVGLLGECVVTTEDNCTFQDGYWHPDKVVCSEVGTDCFNNICEFTWIHRTIGQLPSQGIRFVSAIFLYEGVIHLLIIGLVKLYNSWSIERRIGWLRVFCLYLLSGIGGFLLSGIFSPTKVSVGSSGSLFGLLAVLLVEVLQGWKWVKKPCAELVKIVILVVVLLLLGTLPYIDNFSQIGGFLFGLPAAFIFVPYITIGKWDRAKKLCIVIIAMPVVLVLFLVGLVVFYNLPNPDFCPQCNYINCIPYTATFCDDFISTVLSGLPIGPF